MTSSAAQPQQKTVIEISQRIGELIAEAVCEVDDARRHGLLAMADLWAEVRQTRIAGDTGRRPRRGRD